MDRSTVIYLVSSDKSQDDTGVWRSTETKRKVFANVASVNASEFFEGGRNGLQPELTLTLFVYDYHNERIVEYNGQRYAVYRTYVKTDDTIELHVERRGGLNV